MKELNFEVLKKNRKYFSIKLENNFECKLLITPESENLELGKTKAMVEDISVKTKYGTDVIYKMVGEIKTNKIVTLVHKYNEILVQECRDLGGRFDTGSKAWVFNSMVEQEVEALDELYNSEEVTIDITALKAISTLREPVTFAGYPLARAFGRDSGAKLCDGVAFITGKIGSDGSMKNWGTYCTEGTTFRIKIGKKLLELCQDNLSKKWKIEVKE